MPGFWFLMDSRVMLVMELVSSKASSTRFSGLILRNTRIREREGGALYRRVCTYSTSSLAGRTNSWRIKSPIEKQQRVFLTVRQIVLEGVGVVWRETRVAPGGPGKLAIAVSRSDSGTRFKEQFRKLFQKQFQ
jgi:hypothetical protein